MTDMRTSRNCQSVYINVTTFAKFEVHFTSTTKSIYSSMDERKLSYGNKNKIQKVKR